MQYKIPVQIENEDPIVLGLSLRQLGIIMVGGGLGYSIFTSLAQDTGAEIAAIPAIAIFIVFVMVAIFKYSEMTFIPFILSFIRFKTNIEERKWIKGVDSFQPMDIGFVANIDNKKEKNIDFKNKIDKIKELEDKIKKI